MATPKIAELIFSFLVLAIISAKPPKKAINTSLISNDDLENNSEDSSSIAVSYTHLTLPTICSV